MKPVVVGLVGGAGSGKGSVAAAMARFGFCSIALADALRIEISLAWGIDPRSLADRVRREQPLPALAAGLCTDRAFLRWAVGRQLDLLQPRSMRWAMQHWGTDFRRAQNPAYWTRVGEALVLRRQDAGWRHIVISDVRMHEEAALVRQLGGVLLRVHGHGDSPLAPDARRHDSETQSSRIRVDGDIRNDGTSAGVEHEVEGMLHMFTAARQVEATAS